MGLESAPEVLAYNFVRGGGPIGCFSLYQNLCHHPTYSFNHGDYNHKSLVTANPIDIMTIQFEASNKLPRFFKCLKMLKHGFSRFSNFMAAKNDQLFWQANNIEGW